MMKKQSLTPKKNMLKDKEENMFGAGVFRRCHITPKLLFTYKGKGWFGVRRENFYNFEEDTLYVDLASNITPVVESASHEVFNNLLVKNNSLPKYYITLDWTDRDGFRWNKKDWETFINAVYTLPVNKIYVGCFSGHGRTGTFLAIVSYLLKITNNPVEFVRKNLCEECIESNNQLKYIQKITEFDTKPYMKENLTLSVYEKYLKEREDLKINQFRHYDDWD